MTTCVKTPDIGGESDAMLTQGRSKSVLGKSSQWCGRLRSQEANGAEAQLQGSEQRFKKDKDRKRGESFSECWQVFSH